MLCMHVFGGRQHFNVLTMLAERYAVLVVANDRDSGDFQHHPNGREAMYRDGCAGRKIAVWPELTTNRA
nr:hypothetical protein [Pectobacterium sp. F1-1]